MATKVLWYSTKKDDVTHFVETLERADEYCEDNKMPFNQLVNAALRKFLKLPAIKIAKKEPKPKKAKKAKKKAKKKGAKKGEAEAAEAEAAED